MRKTEILEALVSNPQTVFSQSYRAGYGTPEHFTIEGFTELKKDRWAKKTTTYVTVRACSANYSVYDYANKRPFPDDTPIAEHMTRRIAEHTKNIPLSHVGYAMFTNTDEFFEAEVARYERERQVSVDREAQAQRRQEQAKVLQQLFIATGITEKQDDTMVAYRYRNDARVALNCDEADRLIEILTQATQTRQVA